MMVVPVPCFLLLEVVDILLGKDYRVLLGKKYDKCSQCSELPNQSDFTCISGEKKHMSARMRVFYVRAQIEPGKQGY